MSNLLVVDAEPDSPDLEEDVSGFKWNILDPEALLDQLQKGRNPNVLLRRGCYPIHVAVEADNFKSTMNLLKWGADANVRGQSVEFKMKSGVHVAASNACPEILMALMAFDGDEQEVDGNDNSPMHLISLSKAGQTKQQLCWFIIGAVGGKRCVKGKDNCDRGCLFEETYLGKIPDDWILERDGTTAPAEGEKELLDELEKILRGYANGQKPKLDTHGGRVLTMDGGGVEGVVMTEMLMCIEREFQTLREKVTEMKATLTTKDCFDWIAGTSTGGILAIGLGTGKSFVESQQLYFQLKDTVFKGDRPYSGDDLETCLKTLFPDEVKLNSIKDKRVMVTAAQPLLGLKSRLFRSYPSADVMAGKVDPFNDITCWQAAKYSASAPSYISIPDNQDFLDGALCDNNPTQAALAEIFSLKKAFLGLPENNAQKGNFPEKVPSVVLSLGTGLSPRKSVPAKYFDTPPLDTAKGIFHAVTHFDEVSEVKDVILDKYFETDGDVIIKDKAWVEGVGGLYFRFTPPLNEPFEIDETDDTKLVKLLWETRAYMCGQRKAIYELLINII